MTSRPLASKTSRYIVSPGYDWLFFLSAPTLALCLGMAISNTALTNRIYLFWGREVSWSSLMLGTLVHAHLVIVFFRSHGNPHIFRRYRLRFLFVPGVLYAAMMLSPWLLIAAAMLTALWDVYHSSLQTFGFARMYDRKCGNDPALGRRLDWWLNLLLYAGPVLAGATMMDHVRDFARFEKFEDIGSVFLASVPAVMERHHQALAWWLVALGSVFLAYYMMAYRRLYRQGYQVSLPKVFLLVSTGFCSIYTWGFNSWGEAFLIMNVFHALQYFGLVWAFEHQRMMKLFRVQHQQQGEAIAACVFVGLAFAYGYGVEALNIDITWLWGLTLLVSILHFWYDSFIWSVRQHHV